MTPSIFDWRDDPMGTIVAVPPIRARFMRFEPGFAIPVKTNLPASDDGPAPAICAGMFAIGCRRDWMPGRVRMVITQQLWPA